MRNSIVTTHQNTPPKLQTENNTLILGGSNVNDIKEDRLKSSKMQAFTISQANDVIQQHDNAAEKNVVIHVGVNDLEKLQKSEKNNTKIMSTLLDNMKDSINICLEKKLQTQVLISKILPP